MTHKKRIGELLIERGMIDQKQLERALHLQRRGKRFLGQILIEMGLISETDMYKALAQEFHVKFVDFKSIRFDPNIVQLVPALLAVTRDILPVSVEDNTLYLAMENPRDIDIIQLVEFTTERQVIPVMAPLSQLQDMIRRAYNIKISSSVRPDRPNDLGQLGLSRSHLESYYGLLQQSQGIVLVVGPSGSGKTTSLYASVKAMHADVSRNIVTIEEPIEYPLPGIKQIQVDEEAGLSFSNVLSLIHDQYPEGQNVIAVGELRDADTAQIAMRVSETGHLVLSSLHTTDVVSTITHLYNLNIPPDVIASELLGVMAQRLVREICPFCKTPYQPDEQELRSIGVHADKKPRFIAYKGQGCTSCQGTGYAGQVGIYELLVLDDFLRAEIVKHPSKHDLRKMIRGDLEIETLLHDGIEKIRRGLTTIEEVAQACCITCPGCGHAIPETESVCPICHFPIFELCGQCGARLDMEWRLCPFCGTPKAS
jgi:type II secretory ATPase GspE/PulE/Tfp pilus assembly ATPase PilB-like protein